MKKLIVYILLLTLCPVSMKAQSSMTDNQVAEMIQREVEKGTAQKQIVVKLMQNGVDINQIRRVQKKYQRQMTQAGLGQTSTDNSGSRLRTNNGKTRDEMRQKTMTQNQERNANSSQRLQGVTTWQNEYNEDDQDFLQMQAALGMMTRQDSIEWLNQILEEQEKGKKRSSDATSSTTRTSPLSLP